MSNLTPAHVDTQIVEAQLAYQSLVRPTWDAGGYIIDLTEAQVRSAHALLRAIESLYAGWKRWYLVPGGHLHTDLFCHTLRDDTLVGLFPAASGLAEEPLVAVYGEAVCSHCVPEAPVYKGFEDGTSELSQWLSAVKAAEQGERQAKQAATAAEALTVVWEGRSKTFKTERALSNAVSSELSDIAGYGGTHPSNDEWVANVLGAVELIDIAPIVERVAKKLRAETRAYAKSFPTNPHREYAISPEEHAANIEQGIATIEALVPAAEEEA